MAFSLEARRAAHGAVACCLPHNEPLMDPPGKFAPLNCVKSSHSTSPFEQQQKTNVDQPAFSAGHANRQETESESFTYLRHNTCRGQPFKMSNRIVPNWAYQGHRVEKEFPVSPILPVCFKLIGGWQSSTRARLRQGSKSLPPKID